MKRKQLYLSWLYLYILCATLGFIPPDRDPLITALLTLISIAFFIPPAILLYRGYGQKDLSQLKFVALVSGVSLGLTTLLFIANTLTALAPGNLLLGNIFNALLVVFSAPMFCAPYAFLGLFGWACLLTAAITCRKKIGPSPKRPLKS